MRQSTSAFAARLSVMYGICAALWIFFSDRALRLLVPDSQSALILQTYKGWVFVLVTAMILFFAMRSLLRRWTGELQRSEQRYRELMEQAADGIHLLDSKGNFLLVNAAMAAMLGYQQEELLGMNIVDTYPVGLRGDGAHRLAEVTAGRTTRFERLAMRKDGSSFPVESNVMPLADGTFQGITRDMTDRKKAEEALARSEGFYRTIFERANVSLWEEDISEVRAALDRLSREGVSDLRAYCETHPDFLSATLHLTRVVDVNGATLRLYDAERKEDLIGPLGSTLRLDSPKARESWIDNLMAVAEGREYFEVESAGMTRAGKRIDIVVSSYIPLPSAAYPYMLISVTDVSARTRAEGRLRTSEESLRVLLNASMDAALLLQVDGTLLACNDAFARRFGAAPDAIVGRTLAEVVGAESRGLRRDRVREVVLSGAATRFVDERAGRTFDHSIVPMVEPDGTVSRLAWFIRDITEPRRLEERLRQAQKLESIGRLAGGIAHDFNNILQVIGGYCEVLRQELPAASPTQNDVASITRASQRAAALVAQLMAFSRKQVLQPRVLDTVRLVRSAEKMLERVIGEDIELATRLDPATGNIRADAGQVEQVLLNLALNARDAMPGGGRLDIETSNRVVDAAHLQDHPEMMAGRYVQIEVRDSGVGMDEETISHVFEPFFTTKETGKGTGLGLSTAYGIVKQSEGHITCSSQPGSGTSFTLLFPMVAEEASEPEAVISDAIISGKETILLVEDDDTVRGLARKVLEGSGYTVIEAAGGNEAMRELATRRVRIELLLTDIVMPRMNGRELARRVAEECPGVKVLFASGYAADHFRDDIGGDPDFIQKPFTSQELLAKVRETIDRR